MKYAITENGRAVVLNAETAQDLSSYSNIGASTRPLIKWPVFEETNIFTRIGDQTIALERDFGLLLGLYIGDGWVDKNVQCPKIHIANINDSVIDTFRSLTNRYLRHTDLIGHSTGAREHDYYPEYNSIHGKFSMGIPSGIRHAMIDLFGHGAYNKHIPHDLLHSPKEFRWGLLSGLIDTDGCITHRSVVKKGKMQQNKYAQYATQSWQLAKDVQMLCMSLGISTSISVVHRKGRPEFTLVMSTIDLYNRRHNLSCASGKQKVLDEFSFGAQVNPKDILPYDRNLHKLFLSHNGSAKGGSLFQRAKTGGFITRASFMQYASPKAIEYMQGAYGMDGRWELVLDIAYLPDDHSDMDIINKLSEVRRDIKKAA